MLLITGGLPQIGVRIRRVVASAGWWGNVDLKGGKPLKEGLQAVTQIVTEIAALLHQQSG